MPTKYLDEANHKIWVEISSRRVYRLLCEVWEALPEQAKESAQERISKITDSPSNQVQRGALGKARLTPWGSEIAIPSRRLRKWSDETVKHVIAHEIAHGIFHNEHNIQVLEDDLVLEDRLDAKEEFADTCAREWGFPVSQELTDARRRYTIKKHPELKKYLS